MLDLRTLSKFKPCNEVPESQPQSVVTSLDFSDSGNWVLAASTDDSLHVLDCHEGTQAKTCASKKYGCHSARFTHSSSHCIYASTKEDDAIRYLALENSQFIRYFRGHKNKVTNLEVNPVNESFISSGLDRTVRIWDLKTPNCQGMISVPPPSLVTIDAMGMVFAVASQNNRTIALYDMRNFEKEPFEIISGHHLEGNWQKLEFSNDSKYISLSTDSTCHGLFDAMSGDNKGVVTGHVPLSRYPASISPTAFTVDGSFLVGGSDNNRLCIWDMSQAAEGDKGSIYTPVHETQVDEKPAIVGFNPNKLMMASADTNVRFWVPPL